ncbi:MAG: MotA/TolQ/ExbB proton channel family protein [Deltaproteobacteria bacterium]|nr:MotA/TolQ/ExbB proton channel family protein [Deltaproteobacteria bacterium]
MLTERLLEVAKVGGEWVLYGLILISILSIAVTAERLYFFLRHSAKMEVLVPALMFKVTKGDLEGAEQVLKKDNSEEARMVLRVLEWRLDGRDALRRILDAVVLERRPILEKGTIFLGTVGNNAPFIGLFGTVLGVVEAFEQLGKGTSAEGAGSMDGVMSAISEALIATAVGILVAIPAVVAYNMLARRAQRVEENVERLCNILIANIERSVERGSREGEKK